MNGLKQYLKPPPKLTVSEWADEYRIVSSGNAEPGKWRTARAPYQREPMNCMADADVFRVTLMWGAQLGKTETINNGIGYHIHQNPSNQMMMHPTQGDLSTWLETKLNPLLTDTPEIAERVAKARAREGVNNQRMKSYPGGFLMFAWSGSPNTMRGRSAPRIWCDEVDGYETTQEGDPINLLWQRAATFGDMRQLVVTSTPTIKGASRVEKSFEQGDMRRFWVPCPDCGEHQVLSWGQVKWDKSGDEHLPHTATYVCEHCGSCIGDGQKQAMLKRGEWRAEKPFTGHASFHLSELYSPFRKWRDIVTSFLEKKASGDLQSFVNVSLAETWEEEADRQDPNALYSRREHYPAEVPQGGLVVSCAVDVQDDRFELQYEAWGIDKENWKIGFDVIRGELNRPEIWSRLSAALERRFTHESGVMLDISGTTIDTGGHYTQQVYDFVKRRGYGIFAIKGSSSKDAPIVGRPTRSNLGNVNLFSVGVHKLKAVVMQRARILDVGPGYTHFPVSDEFDREWFEQFTSEELVTRYVKGQRKEEWRKTRPRNEAFDLSVYNAACIIILNPDFQQVKKEIETKQFSGSPKAPESSKPSNQNQGWINNTGNSWL